MMPQAKSKPVLLKGTSMLRAGMPALAIALALAVSACTTVGPNFTSPAAPTVTRYTSPAEGPLSNPDAGPMEPRQTLSVGDKVAVDWWTLYRSPDLERLVKEAIAGSPTLDSAKARLAAARAEVAAARGALYPQVGFSASVAEQKQSAGAFGLTAGQFSLPPSFNYFQIGPTASWTPDLFGGTHRRIEQQAALADFQRDQLGAAYLTLTGATVTEAIQLAAVRAQLKTVDDILEIDRQNLELVRKERQAGSVPDSDVVVAESQLAADETLKPGLDQQLSAARHAIAILLGRAPGEWSPPDLDLATLTLPSRLPVSLPSELVHQRPDIQAAEAQLHAASARIGIATAQLYPSITLSAGISGSSLNGGNLFNPAGLIWSIAAGITQPIFDGGTRRAERRAALADFKAYAADYKLTVLQSFGQVADVLEALEHDAAFLAAQQRALDTASHSVRLQRINYSDGGVGLLNLLDAERQYQQASLSYARGVAQRYQDTTQLLLAMGGGWWGANFTLADNAQATGAQAAGAPAPQEDGK
jgi:NodT family efflux transporter outer membrane factor (OMF) lipoprotein